MATLVCADLTRAGDIQGAILVAGRISTLENGWNRCRSNGDQHLFRIHRRGVSIRDMGDVAPGLECALQAQSQNVAEIARAGFDTIDRTIAIRCVTDPLKVIVAIQKVGEENGASHAP